MNEFDLPYFVMWYDNFLQKVRYRRFTQIEAAEEFAKHQANRSYAMDIRILSYIKTVERN
jgi:hypothetical protein